MKKLNLPAYEFKLKREGKKTKIFDALRKKELVLTPEEWVRQHVVQFLIEERKFPKGLIALEKSLKLNELTKRADILVYGKDAKPVFMVECKAPDVKITQAVFDQISRYNISLKLPYLMVTNGLEHFCAKIDFTAKKFTFLKEIPHFEELNN